MVVKKINVEVVKRKLIEKKFGIKAKEKVRGVTVTGVPGTKRVFLAKEVSPARRKKTLQHEIGHIMTNKKAVISKIPKEEKETLVKFGISWAAKGRLKSKKEALDEGLAEIYKVRKLKEVKTTLFKKFIPKTSSVIDKLIKKAPKVNYNVKTKASKTKTKKKKTKRRRKK